MIDVSHLIEIFWLFSGLNFTTAQVVSNISKVASIFINFTAVHIYDFHIFSNLCRFISVSKLWVYIGINVRSFIMVAFQLILITQVVSVLQVKLEYKWRKKSNKKNDTFNLPSFSKQNLRSVKTTSHDWILRYWVMFWKVYFRSFLFL